MLEISRRAEEAYCQIQTDYYDSSCDFVAIDPSKETSLDMEFKLLENGHFVCKQVREFSGG